MALITLEEAKNYLRVDTSDDDALIEALLVSAGALCADVARLTDEQWAVINGEEVSSDFCSESELARLRGVFCIAELYALAYLYEHREEGDHHELTLMLRSILFSVREGVR